MQEPSSSSYGEGPGGRFGLLRLAEDEATPGRDNTQLERLADRSIDKDHPSKAFNSPILNAVPKRPLIWERPIIPTALRASSSERRHVCQPPTIRNLSIPPSQACNYSSCAVPVIIRPFRSLTPHEHPHRGFTHSCSRPSWAMILCTPSCPQSRRWPCPDCTCDAQGHAKTPIAPFK